MVARSIDNNVRASDKNLVVKRAPSLASGVVVTGVVVTGVVVSPVGEEDQEGKTMSQCKNTLFLVVVFFGAEEVRSFLVPLVVPLVVLLVVPLLVSPSAASPAVASSFSGPTSTSSTSFRMTKVGSGNNKFPHAPDSVPFSVEVKAFNA